MGGRYVDNGQYDHHVWLYRTYMALVSDMICYGTCFTMHTVNGVERIPPEKVMIKS